MVKSKKLLTLFLSFFKIGLFTFGGGYAMIALIEREFVERLKWIENEEFLDLIAVAESTPGPIAVNSAEYIGYKVGKVLGSFVATLGVCIPSIVIIYIVSLFFDTFVAFEYVDYAFRGIQVCVGYLIVSAGFRMLKKMKKTVFNKVFFVLIVAVILVTTLFSFHISSIALIVAGAASGVILYLIKYLTGKISKGE
ncbi:MAG: chromate transporter [Clostridia bacterium]|nr:chromate transporter [Clostridia bacterium]